MTLNMIRQEQEADQNRSASERILAPFMVASPVYSSASSPQASLAQNSAIPTDTESIDAT